MEKKKENPLKRNFEDLCSEDEQMAVEKKQKEDFIPREYAKNFGFLYIFLNKLLKFDEIACLCFFFQLPIGGI